MSDSVVLKECPHRLEGELMLDRQNHGVSSGRNTIAGFRGGMDNLGGHQTFREVGPDNDVLRKW